MPSSWYKMKHLVVFDDEWEAELMAPLYMVYGGYETYYFECRGGDYNAIVFML